MYFIRLKKFLKKHVESQIQGLGKFEIKEPEGNQAVYAKDIESSIPPYSEEDIPPEMEEQDLPF